MSWIWLKFTKFLTLSVVLMVIGMRRAGAKLIPLYRLLWPEDVVDCPWDEGSDCELFTEDKKSSQFSRNEPVTGSENGEETNFIQD